MYAFDDEHRVVVDAQLAVGEQALAYGEVKLGELYLFALQQRVELCIEEGQVEGIE